VEIPKHGEDDVEYNEGFQPEEVFRMEEKQAREDESSSSKRKKKECFIFLQIFVIFTKCSISSHTLTSWDELCSTSG
jgi:hypothetical protein